MLAAQLYHSSPDQMFFRYTQIVHLFYALRVAEDVALQKHPQHEERDGIRSVALSTFAVLEGRDGRPAARQAEKLLCRLHENIPTIFRITGGRISVHPSRRLAAQHTTKRRISL